MNESHNDPNSNAAFNTNPESQAGTNPFTGELKGEFSSDFGTNTNAVSQIFKTSGFSSENRSKYIALGVIGLLVVGLVFYYLTGEDPSSDQMGDFGTAPVAQDMGEDVFGDELVEETSMPSDPVAADPLMQEPMVEEMAPEETLSEAPVQETATMATGDMVLVSPADNASQSYDETSGPAEFSWEGSADRIIFSRSSSMQPETISVRLNGANFYAFENPHPGRWYWQVENASGRSEVRSFRILPSVRRSFPVSQPNAGGALSGNGGVVSWQAGEKIARYAVELTASGSSFARPSYRYSTSGTSVSLSGVSPGAYDIRVGAFSEVAGRWEWQVIENVSVQ